MSTPGFTAEASLQRSGRTYRSIGSPSASGGSGMVEAQFTRDEIRNERPLGWRDWWLRRGRRVVVLQGVYTL